MKASYRKIDYTLRPAKCTERKIIAEIIKCVLHNENLIDDYQYIGFGAIYFYDFKFFHKVFGFNKMICIESHSGDRDRFEFNMPYNNIELVMENSCSALLKLDWTKKTIIWLDYDQSFKSSMLDDTKNTLSKLSENSLFVFTCNKDFIDKYKGSDALQNYVEDFGIYHSPCKKNELSKKNASKLIEEMLMNSINDSIKDRNTVKSNEIDKLEFVKLFKFNYSDGAPMITFGGILVRKERVQIINQIISKNKLQIYEAMDINFPMLTRKEMIYLNQQLPNNTEIVNISSEYSFIPSEEINNYRKFYRYLPIYNEIVEK